MVIEAGVHPAATPLWRIAAVSFVPQERRPLLDRPLRHLPVAAILLTQAVLTLRLHNLANPDEALYIDAGHAYLNQWHGGPHARDYGSYFSGFPYAYPIVAAAIDSVGGLALVRLVSLVLMLAATCCVGLISARIAGPVHARAAQLLGMALAALSASTLFVGNLATFDAPCCALVLLAVTLAVTRTGNLSALLAGLAVAGAAIFKYTGGAFLPVVAALTFLATRPTTRGLLRAGVVCLTGGFFLIDVYVLERGFIGAGIAFTTSSRTAESHRSTGLLLSEFARGAGVLLLLSIAGLLALHHWRRSTREILLALALLAAGLAIPTSQLRIHEYTSFNKHAVFFALFAAPVAAQTVLIRSRVARLLVVLPAAYLALVMALTHSAFMFSEWPDPSHVMTAVNKANRPGTYIGVGADEIGYYEKSHAQFRWTEPWALYGAGPDAVRRAIVSNTYAGVFYTSGSSGTQSLDENTALVARLLTSNPDYELVGTWPKHKYDLNRWYLWLRKPAAG